MGRVRSGKHSWHYQVEKYVDHILDGKKPAGQTIRGACARYRHDLEHAADRGYYFDRHRAAEMLDRFPLLLRHTTGQWAGQPFNPYPWQAFGLWNVFGWRREDNGMRRFREWMCSVARGNGKSPLGAAVMLVLFTADIPADINGEFYTVATMKDQARIVWRDCEAMAKASPDLTEVIQFRRDKLFVDFEVDGIHDRSFLTILGSDSSNSDGLKISAVVRDELHAWRDHHRELLEKIDTAMGKRRQPLAVTITTAGNDRCTLWQEAHAYSSDAARQIIPADQHFSQIYEAEEEDDPHDPRTWAKANPMLEHGVVSHQYLQQESDKARARPEKLASFIRYHAKNRRVSSAEQLISIDKWDACYDPTRQPDPKISPHGGVDLGWVDDLAAFALVWPCEIDGRRCYVVRSWAWIPLETPHHDLDIDPWSSWIRHQHLHTVPGPVMRVQTFYDTIAELHKRHVIKTVAYDPNNLREIAGHCDDLGIDTYGFLQRPSKYNEPIKELLAAVQERRIFHDGNPVLRWCVANLVTKSDEHGYRMPDKKASKSKIDVAVALLMALSEAMFGQFSAPKYVPEPTLL